MSRKTVHPSTVVGWSPKQVTLVDEGSRSVMTYESVAEIASRLSSHSVVVAVSRRAMFIRTLRVPNTSKAEVETLISMRLGDLFPIPGHEVAYSIDLTSDVSSEGRLAVISGMPAAELRKLHEEFRAAGVKVHSVVPMAYGSVLLAQNLKLDACAIASRDEGGTGIDIIKDGTLRYSRIAPPQSPTASEVHRTYAVAGIEAGEIVAAEGVSMEEAHVVSAISPLEALSAEWSSFVPTLELPELVALKRSKALAARRRFSVMLLAAGALLAMLAYFDYTDKAQAASTARTNMETKLASLKEQRDIVVKEAADAATIRTNLRRGFEPAQGLPEVINVVGNRVPTGVWITGLGVERGKQIAIRGTATNSEAVSEFLRNLNAADAEVVSGGDVPRAPRFRDVKLVFANNASIDETTVVQFSISATPVGNIPLVEQATKGSARS